MFILSEFCHISERLSEARRFIQVVHGPRQVGKTTLARKLMEALGSPSVYATADGPALQSAG